MVKEPKISQKVKRKKKIREVNYKILLSVVPMCSCVVCYSLKLQLSS